jgi:hypothetical protein
MFGATAGLPRRFKGNFDFQFVRTMGCATYDGVRSASATRLPRASRTRRREVASRLVPKG